MRERARERGAEREREREAQRERERERERERGNTNRAMVTRVAANALGIILYFHRRWRFECALWFVLDIRAAVHDHTQVQWASAMR